MKNLRTKALAAAMAGAATVACLDASAVPSVANSASPDVTLVVWDPTSGITYVRDLGLSWTAATVATDFSVSRSYSADTNWTTFVSALGGSLPSGVVYDVVSGTVASAANQAVMTIAPTVNVTPNPPNITKSASVNAINLWSNFVVNNEVDTLAQTLTTDPSGHGSAVAAASDTGSVTNPALPWNNGFGSTSVPLTYGTIGTSMSFWNLSASGVQLGNASWKSLAGTWTLASNGALSYSVAAVPEPSEWVLLMAGVAAIGFVARRRVARL